MTGVQTCALPISCKIRSTDKDEANNVNANINISINNDIHDDDDESHVESDGKSYEYKSYHNELKEGEEGDTQIVTSESESGSKSESYREDKSSSRMVLENDSEVKDGQAVHNITNKYGERGEGDEIERQRKKVVEMRMREENAEKNEMENEKDRILSIELKKCRQRIEEKRTSDMVSLH